MVLGEDVAAIAGLLVALAALLVAIATGNSAFDAMGSVAVSVLLMIVVLALAIEIKSLLIGESASPRTQRAIRAFLKGQPNIVELRDLITMQHGEDLIVAIEARMKPHSTAGDLVVISTSVVQRTEPDGRLVFVD